MKPRACQHEGCADAPGASVYRGARIHGNTQRDEQRHQGGLLLRERDRQALAGQRMGRQTGRKVRQDRALATARTPDNGQFVRQLVDQFTVDPFISVTQG